MSKMKSYSEISEILREAEAGSEDLDRLFWSRTYACDYPHTYYDEETFDQCRAEGQSSASMTTNAQMALQMIEEALPKATI